MIKVIAVDMDGTLLNKQGEVSEVTLEAIKKAQQAGMEIIIATGRGYSYAMEPLKKHSFKRRYLLMSGGEVRDENETMVRQILLDYKTSKTLYDICQNYSVPIHFWGDESDYAIGTKEQIRDGMRQAISSFTGIPVNEVEESEIYQHMSGRIKRLDSIEELEPYDIYKAFVFSDNADMLAHMDREFLQIPDIASASSFCTNLEITNIRAQKGLVLKEMVEEMGYSLDEVMALGDSLNDESMLSLPIGAAVAMGNAHEKLKKICPYHTKSNDEDGVAYAIDKVLDGKLEDLRKKSCV